jgi:hypothetical protein
MSKEELFPREKAQKLFNKFFNVVPADEMGGDYEAAKQCALIAVDEIIAFGNSQGFREPIMYWYKVKEEIEKL